jgi:hypothetical protein
MACGEMLGGGSAADEKLVALELYPLEPVNTSHSIREEQDGSRNSALDVGRANSRHHPPCIDLALRWQILFMYRPETFQGNPA